MFSGSGLAQVVTIMGMLSTSWIWTGPEAAAQSRSTRIVVEDSASTPSQQSTRRSGDTSRSSRVNQQPVTEFVLGGRYPSRSTPTLAGVAQGTTRTAVLAVGTTGTEEKTNPPSLVDRLLAVGQSTGTTTAPSSSRRQGVVVTLRGVLPEREQVALFGAPTRSLNSVLSLLRRLRDDKDVSHVVLRLAGLSVGMAAAEEIRSNVTMLRENKKRVIAILEEESQVAYLIALAADEIVMPPSGGLSLTGLQADSYFLKGLLAKVGMEAEFIHQGQYKSMGEVFEREGYSEPARRNMEELVDSLYREMMTLIAAGRRMDPALVKTMIDQGPATTSQALERKLIDRAAYTDEVLEGLKKDTNRIITGEEYIRAGRGSSGEDLTNPFTLLMGLNRPGSSRREDPALARLPQVALVYANGSIGQGGSEEGFEETDAILTDDMIRTLEEVRKDRKVRAVLLRVNSPGGSAFASDLIWRKIREVNEEKPVIASMGSVAASGGYYIAMAARKVFGTSATITGSIGVVGGKFSLAGTYQRLGITKESIRRGAYSGLFSDTHLFNPEERQLVDRQMKEVYEDFLAKAAKSRSMSRDQVHDLAQGRVWTGADAARHGLIDSTAGLSGAIDEVKRQIGIKADDRIALITYPREKNLFDLLSRVLNTSSGSGATLPPELSLHGMSPTIAAELAALWATAPTGLRQALATALRLPGLLERERVLLLAPVAVDIH